jgi:hypothetical protein
MYITHWHFSDDDDAMMMMPICTGGIVQHK